MKTKKIANALFMAGFFPAGYLGWALYRISGIVLVSERHWPRPWPYPDEWLQKWNQQLETVHPPLPGTINFHRQIPRMQIYLSGYIALAFFVMMVAIIWLIILHRKNSNQKMISSP